MDESTMYNDNKNPLLNLTGDASSGISPLEQEVLDEYERLLNNMNEVSDKRTCYACRRGCQNTIDQKCKYAMADASSFYHSRLFCNLSHNPGLQILLIECCD